MHELLALPARLGGSGLTNPTTSAKEQRTTSQQISAPLVDWVINQDHCKDINNIPEESRDGDWTSCASSSVLSYLYSVRML